MVGGAICLMFSSFMLFSQKSKTAAISTANNGKAQPSVAGSDNIKYLQEKANEVLKKNLEE